MNQAFYIKEKKCRLCFETNLKSLINLGKQPLANSLKNKSTSKEIKISLQLCFCKNCKTVQIKETVNPKILFKKYFWQTSTSTTAKKFSNIFCSKILSYLSCNNPFIIEIASNDGTFLVPFKKRGYEVLGVDPAKNLAIKSLKNKIPILNNFFDKKIAKKIIKLKKKTADLVFARNVIAHVKNIHEIADAVYSILSEKGIFAVEFHYAKEILDGLQYDSIYHEHLFYFNLETYSDELTQCMNRCSNVDAWFELYVEPTLKMIHRALEDDAIYAVNIADYKTGKENFEIVERWKQLSEKVGFKFEKTIKMMLNVRPGQGNNKKTNGFKYEGIYIFQKK